MLTQLDLELFIESLNETDLDEFMDTLNEEQLDEFINRIMQAFGSTKRIKMGAGLKGAISGVKKRLGLPAGKLIKKRTGVQKIANIRHNLAAQTSGARVKKAFDTAHSTRTRLTSKPTGNFGQLRQRVGDFAKKHDIAGKLGKARAFAGKHKYKIAGAAAVGVGALALNQLRKRRQQRTAQR